MTTTTLVPPAPVDFITPPAHSSIPPQLRDTDPPTVALAEIVPCSHRVTELGRTDTPPSRTTHRTLQDDTAHRSLQTDQRKDVHHHPDHSEPPIPHISAVPSSDCCLAPPAPVVSSPSPLFPFVCHLAVADLFKLLLDDHQTTSASTSDTYSPGYTWEPTLALILIHGTPVLTSLATCTPNHLSHTYVSVP